MAKSTILSALRPVSQTGLPRATSIAAIRFTSTSSTSPTGPSVPTGTSNGKLPLSWPQYLSLRRQRKYWSTLTSIPTALGGMFLGGGWATTLQPDQGEMIFGLDPMYAIGGVTVGAMLLGYLLGPTVGSSLFSLTHPTLSRGKPTPPLEIMDKALFEHIKKHRATASFQSVNNPTPDYYGEKIISLSTYRRWLRDQAAYKRKALHGVPDEA